MPTQRLTCSSAESSWSTRTHARPPVRIPSFRLSAAAYFDRQGSPSYRSRMIEYLLSPRRKAHAQVFGPTGPVTRISIECEVLKANILGDPTTRVVDIYVPAGHDRHDLPLLVDLVGITSSGLSHTNWVAGATGSPNRRAAHAASRGGFSGLLHPHRRQPVCQLGRHGSVGRLSYCRDAAIYRTAPWMRRRWTPWYLRQAMAP
jgi:hypothetical protein